MGEPKATVVVVNWNGERLLRPCLNALGAQTMPTADWQVWVVDNASVDDSVGLLEAEFPWVRIIRNDKNLGFAGGNNTALRQVSTPFAVLLNNDATPEPDWLEHLLAPFDEPGAEGLAVTASKIVFLPRFLTLTLNTEGFSPGAHDPRELGVRIHSLAIDGEEAAPEVLWEKLTYGPEGGGSYRWTRPSGPLLLPIKTIGNGPHLAADVTIAISWAAEKTKNVLLSWPGGSTEVTVGSELSTATFSVSAGAPVVDVINNVGGIVLTEGYGADRGYQEVDGGQYDKAEEVFIACGNGAAIRAEVGHAVDWFDDDFFLYYEDSDLFWRIRSQGWSISYRPDAVLRHVHAASSGEWSPLFVFHVDRNRLLMLTKNASRRLAMSQVLRYPLTTGSMALRALRQGLAERRRPPLRMTLLQLSVIRSYLRLLPSMLHKRRVIRRAATEPRTEVERWLVRR